MHSWSTFGARTNHKHIQTYKTHHDLNLGEALIIFSMIHHMAYIQMVSFLELPSWDSWN
jgi:hypothetical protein